MSSKRQIIFERLNLVSLRNLVDAYQEISAVRVQRVRGAVLQSRLFMQEMVDVFAKARVAYIKRSKGLTTTKRLSNRTVAVFVSANAGLYGDIVERTFEKFSQFITENDCDVVVMGRLGMTTMNNNLPKLLFNYFDFSDESVDLSTFDVVMRYLIQFEKIVVFHGLFKTILVQEPVVTQVSGQRIGEDIGSVKRSDIDFLFEPSPEEVARVFEGEIEASIFEQTLHESVLAKQASRMLSLDKSLDNIDKRLQEVKKMEVRIMHRVENKKRLSTISGQSLWGGN